MKKQNIRTLASAALLGLLVLTVNVSLAQTVVKETTTTTTAGTISEFGPEMIVIRTETAPEPVRYTYSKTTTYVDEAGAPVSIETVKSGLPVSVCPVAFPLQFLGSVLLAFIRGQSHRRI